MICMPHMLDVVKSQLDLMLDDVELFLVVTTSSNGVRLVAISRNIVARVVLSEKELYNRLTDAGGPYSLAWELLVMLKDGGIEIDLLKCELPFLKLKCLQ